MNLLLLFSTLCVVGVVLAGPVLRIAVPALARRN
jgi:hypothetical protein